MVSHAAPGFENNGRNQSSPYEVQRRNTTLSQRVQCTVHAACCIVGVDGGEDVLELCLSSSIGSSAVVRQQENSLGAQLSSAQLVSLRLVGSDDVTSRLGNIHRAVV